MNTLSLIIVDDEQDSIDVIENLLKEVAPHVVVKAKCTSADDAVQQIERHDPDLVLLDVEMPNKNGFELLKAFSNPRFKVIFITGYDQYAIKAIKFSAVDYLLKPLDIDELGIAMEKVKAMLNKKDERISHLNGIDLQTNDYTKVIISSKSGFETLALENIVSIESKPGNYAIFSLKDGSSTMATKPLNHYAELFQDMGFFRIHRSFVVNLTQVTGYDNAKAMVEMSNGHKLEVAHRRKSDFLNQIRGIFSS